MPRKLVRNSSGWYGWEARFNSIIRMSSQSMANTNAQNKKERFRSSRCQSLIREEENRCKEKNRTEVVDVRKDLVTMRAYGKVYHQYSFSSRMHQHGDTQMTIKSKKSLKTAKAKQSKQMPKSPCLKSPVAKRTKEDKDVCVKKNETASKTQAEDRTDHKPASEKDSEQTKIKKVSFSQEEPSSMHGSSTSIAKTEEQLGKSNTFLSKSPEVIHEEEETPPPVSYFPPSLHTLPSITNVYQKQREKKDIPVDPKEKAQIKASKWQRVLFLIRQKKTRDILSKIQEPKETEIDKEEKAPPMTRQRAIFLGRTRTKQEIRAEIFPAECRNTFTLRRFIDRQVEDLMNVWTPETVRRYKVQQILDQVKFPELVQRSQSTSAIFRNYRSYKEKHGLTSNSPQKMESINEISMRKLREQYKERGSEADDMKVLSASSTSVSLRQTLPRIVFNSQQ